MENLNYTINTVEKNALITENKYTHTPYPILCIEGYPVTYIDLIDFGKLEYFGILDNEAGLNPSTPINTWQDFIRSIDKHLRTLHARIQSLESYVSMISIIPDGNQVWPIDKTQDEFISNVNVSWALSNNTDFNIVTSTATSATISFIGSSNTGTNTSGTLQISTDKASYNVGEVATITIRYNNSSNSSESVKLTTVTATSVVNNASKSFTITKYVDSSALSSVICTYPTGVTQNKTLTNNVATFTYTFNTAGQQTFTASGNGVESVSTTVTVSGGSVVPSDGLYWYVGTVQPSDPSNPEENKGIINWDENRQAGTGYSLWTPITSTPDRLPIETIRVRPAALWYVAIPHSYSFHAFDTTGASRDTAAYQESLITINGVQYTLFTSSSTGLKVNAVWKYAIE